MSNAVTVARLSDVPPGSVIQVLVGGEQIALYNCAGTLYATTNICSHSYAELHEGYLDCDDCVIECPLHGARFDLATGRALSLPATAPIATYPVTIEDGMILLTI